MTFLLEEPLFLLSLFPKAKTTNRHNTASEPKWLNTFLDFLFMALFSVRYVFNCKKCDQRSDHQQQVDQIKRAGNHTEKLPYFSTKCHDAKNYHLQNSFFLFVPNSAECEQP